MKHPTAELADLASGDLDRRRAATLHEHLVACDECRMTWEHLVALEHRLQAIPRLKPAPNFIARVEERVAALAVVQRRPLYWRVPAALVLAGSLWIVLVLGTSSGPFLSMVHDAVIRAPEWNDVTGWFTWLANWSMQFETTVVLALCLTTIGTLLVVVQQLQSDQVAILHRR